MNEVYYGDCLEYMKSLPDSCIDLIVTDPPYDVEDMVPYFTEFLRLLKESGSIYIFGDKNMVAEHWFFQMTIEHKELLVWYYKNSPKPKGRWRVSMQAIIYGHKSKDLSVFHEDAARVEYMPATKKLNGRVRPSPGRLNDCLQYDTSKGALPRDVIEHPALTGHLSRERVGHSDQKPLGLIEKIIEASSNVGDLVFDSFGGTGTTAIACKNTGRSCITCEKDKLWYDYIVGEIQENVSNSQV